MKYAKFIGGFAIAVGLFFAIRWCAITIEKAGERDAFAAQLKQEREQNAANIGAIAQDIHENEKDRAALAGHFAEIDARFDNLKIPPAQTLIQPLKEIPGAPCNSFGLSDSFVRVYNEAGAAAGPAETKTD